MAQRVVVALEDDYDGLPIEAADQEEPTTLAINGTEYVLDLRTENVLKLWEAVEPFVARVHPVRVPKKKPGRKKRASAPALPPVEQVADRAAAVLEGAENLPAALGEELEAVRPELEALAEKAAVEEAQVEAAEPKSELDYAAETRAARAYGRENGWEVGKAGRIPASLREAYRASLSAHPAGPQASSG